MANNDPRQNTVTINNVPALARKTDWSLPVPPLRRGSSKDGELDMNSTQLAVVKKNTRHLVTLVFSPGGKIGFRRNVVTFQEFTGTNEDWANQLNNFAAELQAQSLDVLPDNTKAPRPEPEAATANVQAVAVPTNNPPEVSQTTEAVMEAVTEILHEHIAVDATNIQTDANGTAVPRSFSQLRVPKQIPHYISTPEISGFLDDAKHLADADSNGCYNAILYGDTSGGKTDGVKQWAAERGFRCIRIDCSTVTDVLDFLGDINITAGPNGPETRFQPSEYIQALLDPDFAVILLDEVNRVQAPPANNFQMAVLDDTRGLFVRQAGFYLQVRNKLFVATLNGPVKGSDAASYAGTQPLDEALISRFSYGLEVKYPSKTKIVKILTKAVPGLDQQVAGAMGSVANELAKHGFHKPNLRELLTAARLIGLGKTPFQALNLTIGRVYPNEGMDSQYTTFLHALEGQGITEKGKSVAPSNDKVCNNCGLLDDLCTCN